VCNSNKPQHSYKYGIRCLMLCERHCCLSTALDRRFLRCRGKIKSFGLIEALIASFVLVTVIVGATWLASSNLKSALTSKENLMAEHVATDLSEKILVLNSAGFLDYDTDSFDKTIPDNIIPVECFDTLAIKSGLPEGCVKANGKSKLFVPPTGSDENGFILLAEDYLPGLLGNTFAYRIAMKDGVEDNVAGFIIPSAKKRTVMVIVGWDPDSSGKYTKRYYQSVTITDYAK